MSSVLSLQARNADLDRTEAVEEIFAEAAGKDFGAKVSIGGGNQADVHMPHFRRADALNFAVLNDAQELRLHLQRGLADFVEKHSTAVGVFEEAGASIRRASECAADVTEELAFEKRVNERGAIADGETLLSDRAHVVQGASDELLARAGGAGDENIRVVARDLFRQVKNFKHCRTSPDDAVELEILEETILEIAYVRSLREQLSEIVECFRQAREIQRLRKVIVGAAFDGVDGSIHGVVASDEDDVDARVVLENFFEKCEPVHGRHFEVCDDGAAAAEADLLKRLLRVSRADGGEAELCETVRGEIDEIGFVVKNADRKIFSSRTDDGFFFDCEHAAV